jgi:hypothetical protein
METQIQMAQNALRIARKKCCENSPAPKRARESLLITQDLDKMMTANNDQQNEENQNDTYRSEHTAACS